MGTSISVLIFAGLLGNANPPQDKAEWRGGVPFPSKWDLQELVLGGSHLKPWKGELILGQKGIGEIFVDQLSKWKILDFEITPITRLTSRLTISALPPPNGFRRAWPQDWKCVCHCDGDRLTIYFEDESVMLIFTKKK